MTSLTTATPSTPLNASFRSNADYLSTHPHVHIDITSDESSPGATNEPLPEPARVSFSIEAGTQHKLCDHAQALDELVDNLKGQGRSNKISAIASLGALATLVTMKCNGHIDEHPNYFWVLAVSLAVSSAPFYAKGSHFSQYAHRVQEKAEAFPAFLKSTGVGKWSVTRQELFQANASLGAIKGILTTSVEPLQKRELSCRNWRYYSSFIADVMLITMAFKGHFDKHPAYLTIMLTLSRLSDIIVVMSELKGRTYPDDMKKIAKELPLLDSHQFSV